MIKYDRLWVTLKEKNISQYKLIKDYGIDKAQLHRLRKNMVVKTIIINNLCRILDCKVEDIMEYIPDEDSVPNKNQETNNKIAAKKTHGTVGPDETIVLRKKKKRGITESD